MLLFALLTPPNETEEGRSPNANKKSDVLQQTSDFYYAGAVLLSGYACWSIAASRNEFSSAALRRQESSQPIADAKIKH